MEKILKLQINDSKSINGERIFEVVLEFTYLGSKVSNDQCMEAELRARMQINQFTSKNMSRRTKLRLYSIGRLWTPPDDSDSGRFRTTPDNGWIYLTKSDP